MAFWHEIWSVRSNTIVASISWNMMQATISSLLLFYQRFVLEMPLGNSFLQLMMGCLALIATEIVLKVRQAFLLPFWCNKESNEKIKKGCRHFVNVFTSGLYVCGFEGKPRAVVYFLKVVSYINGAVIATQDYDCQLKLKIVPTLKLLGKTDMKVK